MIALNSERIMSLDDKMAELSHRSTGKDYGNKKK